MEEVAAGKKPEYHNHKYRAAALGLMFELKKTCGESRGQGSERVDGRGGRRQEARVPQVPKKGQGLDDPKCRQEPLRTNTKGEESDLEGI